MRLRCSRFLVAALLITATSFTTSAAVRPPKLQYNISTLPNGLTLVLSEDHSTPIVHMQVWYHVGSKNEGPEEHTSMMTSLGGQSNAYTTDDETVFWESVPQQYLPLIMWLEAD